MPFSHLRFSVPSLPTIHLPKTPFSPLLYYVVYCTQLQASTKRSCYQVSVVKNDSFSFGLINCFRRVHASQALDFVDTEEPSDFEECCVRELGILSEEKTLSEKVQLESCSSSAESFVDVDEKEIHRRRKIGLANKGRVPWNKGRKHSAETRERIRQRTIEALMNPKVKKKMSECSRAHSDQTKEKIRSSLTRLWGERLKWKKSREKFLSSWAKSIAEAARKGGSDQRELHWDSYDKIKEEIALQQHQWAADRAKAKEMAKIQAAERKVRLAQKRLEQEQKAKARGEIKRKTSRKSKEEREDLVIAQGLKLKERLTKIHKRKTLTNGQIVCKDQRAWEKLDLEFIKREHVRREVSLADQIRAVKTKRVEFVAMQKFANFINSDFT